MIISPGINSGTNWYAMPRDLLQEWSICQVNHPTMLTGATSMWVFPNMFILGMRTCCSTTERARETMAGVIMINVRDLSDGGTLE